MNFKTNILWFVIFISMLISIEIKAQSNANVTVIVDWLYHGERCEKAGMPEFTWKLSIGSETKPANVTKFECLKSMGDDADDRWGSFMPSMAPNKDRGKGWFWNMIPTPLKYNGVIDEYRMGPNHIKYKQGEIPFYFWECFENDKGDRCGYGDKDGCHFEDPSGSQAKAIDINKLIPFRWANNKDYFFDYDKIGVSFDIYWEPGQLTLNAPETVAKETIYERASKKFIEQGGTVACGGEGIKLTCSVAYGHPVDNPVKYYWYVQCNEDPSYGTQQVFSITDRPSAVFTTPGNIEATRRYHFQVRPFYLYANQFGNGYSVEQVMQAVPARPTVDPDALTLINPSCYKYNDGTLKIDFSKVNSPAVPKSFNYNLASDQPEFGSSSGVVNAGDYTFDSISVNYTLSDPNSYFTEMPYTLQILNTDGQCSRIIKNINIIQPNRLQIDTNLLRYNNSHISCFDSTDGRVSLQARGGTLPYQFYINEFPLGNQLAASDAVASSFLFTRLKPDTRYDFHVTDAHSCFAFNDYSPFDTAKVKNVILNKPDPIRDIVYAREYLKEPAQRNHNVSCFGYDDGELYVQIIKDSTELLNPSYRIKVDNRTDSSSTVKGADFNSPVFATSAGKVKKGFYTIYILDANNCPHQDTITLYQPDKLILSKTDSALIKCFGRPDGMMELKSIGGTKAYNFFKDNFNNGQAPSTSPVRTILSDSTARYTNLISGPPQYHIFYVTDVNSCRDSVRFNLPEPAPLEVSLEVSNIVCHDDLNGKLTADAKGGTGTYTYEWYDGNPIPNEYGPQLDSLGPIYYSVTVKDVNNCQASDNKTLLNPATIQASVYERAPLSCADRNDASITIDSVQGGWQGFQYSKDGINYYTDPFFTNLAAGVYDHLSIQDVSGCVKRLDTIEILKPKSLTAVILESNGVNCFGNSDAEILLKITEGKKPYSVQLNGQTKSGKDSLYRFTGLAAGTYILSVSDANNCSFGKEIYIYSPAKLQDTILQITKAANGLNDGSATITAIGGVKPYNYTWLLPNQAAPNDKKIIRSESDPVTVGNLYAELYQVNITDAKGCAHTAYVGVSNVNGPTIDNTTITPPLCSYTTDGQVIVNASTPNPPLSYYWPALNDTDNSIDQLPGGSYDLKITDALGNITTLRAYVNAPNPLDVDMITYPSICYGQCDGVIEANLSGGTQPYTYAWDDANNQSTYRASQLCEGSYNVAIADAHGCTTSAVASLINPAKVTPQLGGRATICNGQIMTLDAGYEGSTYLWTSSFGFGSSNQVIKTKIPGTYYLTVVDPFGCVGKDTFLLETSSTVLTAEFVEPTKNYVGETIVFSEISWPRPESVQWVLGSADSIDVISQTAFLKKVIYKYPGTYNVRMIASLGECRDTMDKVIKIFAQGDIPGYNNGKVAASSIEELLLFPNPNAGKFTASIKLNKNLPVTITVHDVYGNILKQFTKEGSLSYDVSIELNQLAGGIYSLRATTEEDTRSVMFTIQY